MRCSTTKKPPVTAESVARKSLQAYFGGGPGFKDMAVGSRLAAVTATAEHLGEVVDEARQCMSIIACNGGFLADATRAAGIQNDDIIEAAADMQDAVLRLDRVLKSLIEKA